MRTIPVLSIVMVLGIAGTSYAQLNIPRENIPANISPPVRKQIERLYSSDPKERGQAADELGAMGKGAIASLPFLIELLSDGQVFGTGRPGEIAIPAIAARRALVNMGKPAVDLLITALKDKSTQIRYGAADSLGDLKDRSAVEPLIAAMQDEYAIVRQRAVEALGKIKDRRAIEPLIATMKEENAGNRQWVAWALEQITGQDLGQDSARWQAWWDKHSK